LRAATRSELGKWKGDFGSQVIEPIRALAAQVPGVAAAVGMAIVNGIRSGPLPLPGMLGAVMAGAIAAVRAATSGAASAAGAVGSAIVGGLRGALGPLLGMVRDKIGDVAGAVRGFADVARSAGFSIGAAIVQGIGSGIKSLVGGIAAQAADAVRGIVDAMKSAARIRSPSELTERLIGRPLAEGIIVGFLGSHLKEALLGHVQEAKQGIDDFVGSTGVANMAAQGMMMGAAYRSSLAAAMAGVTQPAIAGTPWMPMGRSGPIAEPRVRSLSPDGAVVYNTNVNVAGFVGSEHRLADEITSLLQRRSASGGPAPIFT
jgi:phage-related protein